MSELLDIPTLTGTPMYGSPYVPEDSLLRVEGAIYFHSRLSVRGRRRRPHGRTNGPKHWKIKVVRYEPTMDRLRRVSA